MKRILITGKDSYIGNSFKEWVSQWPEKYHVDEVDTREDVWKEYSFSGYDSILHVAGIAHIKESQENKDLYYKVNRDLAIKVAKKAKKEGVKQFILLSSMSVYGLTTGVINNNTPLNPKNAYGKSKLDAEVLVKQIKSEDFIISIIRPPLVYGNKSPGNYQSLSSFIKKYRIFPDYSNKRSMIFINNLTEFFRLIIESQVSGIFMPQNNEYVDSKELANQIAHVHSKKILFIPNVLNIFGFLNSHINIFSKVLGDLIYTNKISELVIDNKVTDYNVVSFESGIEVSENG